MRDRAVGLVSGGVALVVGLATGLGVAVASASPANGKWGGVTLLLPAKPWSMLTAIDCTGPGDCTAGGLYGWFEPSTQSTAFVVTETHGTWGTPADIPGVSELGESQYASVTAISCVSPGNCAAGGYYLPTGTSQRSHAFVADQVSGTWQRARPVAGIPAPDSESTISAISCAPAKVLDCVAVGGSADTSTGARGVAFTVAAVSGAWAAARPVQPPSGAATGAGENTTASAVSCAGPGACTLGGSYRTVAGAYQALVATQVNGTWGRATGIAAALNGGGQATVAAIDCLPAAVRSCAVAGYYLPAGLPSPDGPRARIFVVGYGGAQPHWGRPVQLPGSAGYDGLYAIAVKIACPSAAACEVGGTMIGPTGYSTGFLGGETHGQWSRHLHQVPGSDAGISALSCHGPHALGNCTVGGYIGTAAGPYDTQALALDEANGQWDAGTRLPGSGAGPGGGHIAVLSCGTPHDCAAGGTVDAGRKGAPAAFVAREAP